MNKYSKAELDKISDKEINRRANKNLLSLSIFLNQLRTLIPRVKDNDTLETIHASLTKNKILIDEVLEKIDNEI